MPRAYCRSAQFECLTCLREFNGMWWRGDPDSSAERWNMKTQSDLQSHSDCSLPHIRVKWFGGSGSNSHSQVRESQRAVVYQFPDGTWAQPGSNDPNDPVAVSSARDGGIRREFYHTRDMHEFNHEQRAHGGGELSGYNDVVDFDEPSLRQRDTVTQEIALMHERDANLRLALQMIGGAGSQGRYEKLKREHENRR